MGHIAAGGALEQHADQVLGAAGGSHGIVHHGEVEVVRGHGVVQHVHGLDMHVHANASQLRLEHVGQLDALVVVAVGDELQAHGLAILLQDAVAVGILIAVLGQKRRRAFGVVAGHLQLKAVGVAIGQGRGINTIAGGGIAIVDDLCKGLAVDAHADGVAQRLILHQGPLLVVAQEVGAGGGLGVHHDALGIGEHGGTGGGKLGDQVDLAVLQGHVQGLIVIDDLELDIVHQRTAAPVVLVGDHGDLGHGGESRGDEGAGAGHAQLGVGLLGGVIDAHQRVAQVVDDGGVRRSGDQGQHLPVRLHRSDVQRGGRAVVDLVGALEAGLHGGGVHGVAVGEGHALADGELPSQLVHILIALGDPGLGHVVLVQPE